MTDFDVITMSKYYYQDPVLLKESLFNSLKTEFNNHEQKWLVNCVGYTGKPNVDACESDKQTCWDLNVTFPTILADFCLQNNIKVINISSGCIYDGSKNYTEEDDPLSTKEVTEILDKYGMWNPHWTFINYEQLKEHITANRSNCVLSVDKSIEYGLQFPCERDSLNRILSPDEE